VWTKEALHDLIEAKLCDHPLILVANREPYQHRFANGTIECVPPASGMVSALDPIMRACGGVWIAHGSGSADRRLTDEQGYLAVPPEDPSYTLRRIWLTKEEFDAYYNGVSNQSLWPLCHMVFTRPVFDPREWPIYQAVNAKFADAVLEEADGGPAFVFIQDYHFGVMPRMLKESNPHMIIAQFWHIPWPSPAAFETFPWKEELLDGLLGNDLLGFHLRSHCQNFLDTVDRVLEAKIDYERFEITRGGKSTLVRPFPIGIDFEAQDAAAAGPMVQSKMKRWREQLGLGDDQLLGLGIDRIDYTKGLPERFRALDRLLEKFPEYRQRLVFVQIGVPSRTHVRQYKLLDAEIDGLVEEINWTWGTDSWRPIIYLKQLYGLPEMMALHRLANFCVVNSLDDGMNLVAKEFVASRGDGDGALVLSWFTGAARELTSALLVNPFDIDQVAGAMDQALQMPEDERRKRMQKLRTAVADNNIYRWAGKFLSALMKFDFPETNGAELELAARVGE
jgi:trehalose 6-phosphate synthase